MLKYTDDEFTIQGKIMIFSSSVEINTAEAPIEACSPTPDVSTPLTPQAAKIFMRKRNCLCACAHGSVC